MLVEEAVSGAGTDDLTNTISLHQEASEAIMKANIAMRRTEIWVTFCGKWSHYSYDMCLIIKTIASFYLHYTLGLYSSRIKTAAAILPFHLLVFVFRPKD